MPLLRLLWLRPLLVVPLLPPPFLGLPLLGAPLPRRSPPFAFPLFLPGGWKAVQPLQFRAPQMEGWANLHLVCSLLQTLPIQTLLQTRVVPPPVPVGSDVDLFLFPGPRA